MKVRDTVEYWLNLPKNHPDYWNKPKRSPECKSKCKIENVVTSKRFVRMTALCGQIDIDDDYFRKLCLICKATVYDWVFNDVWVDHPEVKVSPEIFEAEIYETNDRVRMQNSLQLFQKFLMDAISGVRVMSLQELEGYRRHTKRCEQKWIKSSKEFNERVKEEDAKSKGYEL